MKTFHTRALVLGLLALCAWLAPSVLEASNLAPNRVLSKGGAIVGSKRHYSEFRTEPVTSKKLGGAVTGSAGDENIALFPGECLEMPSMGLEWHVLGTQTILAPTITASGLNIGMDQTDNDGIELAPGITARCPQAFTVGTDGAFYFKATVTPADASGCDPVFIGFRKVQDYEADYNDYDDLAAIGIYAGDIKTETIVGDAATVTTDTTDNASDATAYTFEVRVSSAGVVTYLVNGSAPTTTAAYTFTNGAVVVPVIHFLHGADVAGTVNVSLWDAGLQ